MEQKHGPSKQKPLNVGRQVGFLNSRRVVPGSTPRQQKMSWSAAEDRRLLLFGLERKMEFKDHAAIAKVFPESRTAHPQGDSRTHRQAPQRTERAPHRIWHPQCRRIRHRHHFQGEQKRPFVHPNHKEVTSPLSLIHGQRTLEQRVLHERRPRGTEAALHRPHPGRGFGGESSGVKGEAGEGVEGVEGKNKGGESSAGFIDGGIGMIFSVAA
ncbi:hypothetical protein M433DRAFT_483973 [Acidomyces richmondensis BFW]|nr:MAG: hypothetical protein FE78DRAFT_279552 [Acidomyces sp. 'richmondensis']KYG47652.1 hypothetical protein M433DRAFT_483973 [Acidomyces richmondensis BFW]